jgi:TRAP-type mannitol/chloroaromatic compound transport system permease small subunit
VQKILSAVDTLSAWSGKATSLCCGFMVLAIIYEVIMRYVFNTPTLWVTEAVVFSGALIYVVAGAWTMLEDQHIRVDFIYERFSAKNRAILDAISYFFFLIYICGILWASSIYAMDSIKLLEKTGSPWNPPVYPFKAAFVFGIILILLQGTAKFIRDLLFIFKKKE